MVEVDTGSLFSLFLCCILPVVLVPVSIRRARATLHNYKDLKDFHSTGTKGTSRKSPLTAFATRGNALLLAGWLVWALLLWHATSSSTHSYEPLKILGLESGATDADIKRAYRQLSLKYHPDKNPSAGASKLFDFYAKAYKALTDPAAKLNMERYGHPDGDQGWSEGFALPEWIFPSDQRLQAVLLLLLLMVGILLPVVGIAVYSLDNGSGAPIMGQIMAYVRSDAAIDAPVGVKKPVRKTEERAAKRAAAAAAGKSE